MEPPEGGGGLLDQGQLIESLVLLLLVADVRADDRLVSPYGRDEVPACPEVLPDEVAFPLAERPRDMHRALALDVTDHVRDRELRRNREQHVHVVDHQVPFLDPAFLVLRKRAQDRTEFSLDGAEDRLA